MYFRFDYVGVHLGNNQNVKHMENRSICINILYCTNYTAFTLSQKHTSKSEEPIKLYVNVLALPGLPQCIGRKLSEYAETLHDP